ncbi:hypothetical protein SANTM175S_09850 [Streptomyces antimycoticus]
MRLIDAHRVQHRMLPRARRGVATSASRWRAIPTAAVPTPPVAAWISTDSPGRTAQLHKPYQAVRNTTGAAADLPEGPAVGDRVRPCGRPPRPAGRTALEQAHDPVATASPVTSGPISSTTPAPSLPPNTASRGQPNTISTSRKSTPAAWTSIRTWRPQRFQHLRAGHRPHAVHCPAPSSPSRHADGPTGAARPPLRRRPGHHAPPARSASCDSSISMARATASATRRADTSV